jgi:polysaccharide biosynthesis PFTS motif protein
MELPVLPKNTIAVFDVQPVRDAFYKTLGISFEYYVPKVCNQFISDIFDVSQSLDLSMAWKPKRDIGKKIHPTYRNFIKKIEISSNFILVDANISAIKLIEKSSIVISMPFTSTAILARELKKPSIFYDPLNMLQKNDPGAHGIPIITGIADLKKWVISNL